MTQSLSMILKVRIDVCICVHHHYMCSEAKGAVRRDQEDEEELMGKVVDVGESSS